MTKTLGQVAYEAWLPPSTTHRKRVHIAWQAAAEAVIEHYLTTETEAPLDFIKYRHEVRAVIEAAKALVEAEAMDFDGGEPLTSAEQALVTAVEALQEVEGG